MLGSSEKEHREQKQGSLLKALQANCQATLRICCVYIPGIHIFFETLNLLKGFTPELQNVLRGCSLKVMLTAKLLWIESLQTRHCFFDLIEVNKILNNLTSLGPDQLFTYDLSQRTRGYNFKLKKVHCRLDCRKHFFCQSSDWFMEQPSNEIVNSITLLFI